MGKERQFKKNPVLSHQVKKKATNPNNIGKKNSLDDMLNLSASQGKQ